MSYRWQESVAVSRVRRQVHLIWKEWGLSLTVPRSDAQNWYKFFSSAVDWDGEELTLQMVNNKDQLCEVPISWLRQKCRAGDGIFSEATTACIIATLYPLKEGSNLEQQAFHYNNGLIKRWLHSHSVRS